MGRDRRRLMTEDCDKLPLSLYRVSQGCNPTGSLVVVALPGTSWPSVISCFGRVL